MANLSLGGAKQIIWTTSSFVVPTAIVFLGFLAFFLYPRTFVSPIGTSPCQVGNKPDSPEILKNLPAVNSIDEPEEIAEYGGGPDRYLKADYILIRKNVRVSKKATEHFSSAGVPQVKSGYTLVYPTSDGGKSVESAASGHLDLRIRHEGILLLMNNDPATQKNMMVIDHPNSLEQPYESVTFQVDVYQDISRYTQSRYTPDELFTCGTEAQQGAQEVVWPTQSVSPNNEQLQLAWFVFQQGGVWGVHCKPAIYLYPPQKEFVNVQVSPKGELGYTDPPYPNGGWTVEAYPDGTLEAVNQLISRSVDRYDYLYYESKIYDSVIKKPTSGWVVRQSEMEELFNRVLPQLGLNAKEEADFKQYWLHKLPNSPYYFVGLMDKAQRDYLEPLTVSPQPDTSIRFSLYFEPLNQPKTVAAPVITTPKRTGFTLVDWGGMIKLHPGTPFTCSQ